MSRVTPSRSAADRLAAGRFVPEALRRIVPAPGTIERSVQRPDWLRAFLVSCLVLALLVVVQLAVDEMRADNAWGLFYGAMATVLIFAAAALGIRRRTMRRGFGRAQDWAQLHVYGGTLAFALVLLHAGFRWPGEALTGWLLGLSAWVTLSGLVGVVLRRWIPRVLSSGLATEVLYERIPELSTETAERAREVAAMASPPVRDFFRRNVEPHLGRPKTRWIFFVDVTGGIERRLRAFQFLRDRLSLEDRRRVDELGKLLRTQLELDAHLTLQRPLRWWLWAHVPVSLVLLVSIVVHVATVLYY